MNKLRQTLHALSHIFLKQKHTRYIKVVMEGKRLRYEPFELPTTAIEEGLYYPEPQLEMREEAINFIYEATRCDICGRIDLIKNIGNV